MAARDLGISGGIDFWSIQISDVEKMAQSDTIQNDSFQCVKCGYCLYSLSEYGKCPECHTPVRESIRQTIARSAAATTRFKVANVLTAGALVGCAVLCFFLPGIPYIAAMLLNFLTLGAIGVLTISVVSAVFAWRAFIGGVKKRWLAVVALVMDIGIACITVRWLIVVL